MKKDIRKKRMTQRDAEMKKQKRDLKTGKDRNISKLKQERQQDIERVG